MKHNFLALTNPIPGREDDFNRWYDNHHLQEVLRYGNGFSSGRRYKLDLLRSRPSGGAWAYLASYALESKDLEHFHRHPWIENRPALTPFTGLLADDHVGWVYTPAAPAVGSEATLPPTHSPNLLFLLSASQSGKDAEQRDIIDGRIKGMAKMPGLLLAQRYELARHQRERQVSSPWQHLELYALDPSFDAATLSSLSPASLPVTETAHSKDPKVKAPAAWFFTAVGDALLRSDL
jgi:hypothetical protein